MPRTAMPMARPTMLASARGRIPDAVGAELGLQAGGELEDASLAFDLFFFAGRRRGWRRQRPLRRRRCVGRHAAFRPAGRLLIRSAMVRASRRGGTPATSGVLGDRLPVAKRGSSDAENFGVDVLQDGADLRQRSGGTRAISGFAALQGIYLCARVASNLRSAERMPSRIGATICMRATGSRTSVGFESRRRSGTARSSSERECEYGSDDVPVHQRRAVCARGNRLRRRVMAT